MARSREVVHAHRRLAHPGMDRRERPLRRRCWRGRIRWSS